VTESALISVPEVQGLLESIVSRAETISVPLNEAIGRTLGEDITADRDGPPYDRVMMDGYALRAKDADAGGFEVTGKSVAGTALASLEDEPGVAVEVMTGTTVPSGADAIVPYEWTKREGSRITLIEGFAIEPNQFIHFQGSDYKSGEVLVREGTIIGPVETSIAATCGHGTVEISGTPRIAILSTGDELVPISETPKAHQLRQSNGSAIESILALSGFPAKYSSHLSDEVETEAERLSACISAHEITVISGGVSKGTRDWIPGALDNCAERLFHGVAQSPGKPFGVWTDGKRAIFALPGNPVSTIVGAIRWVIPFLQARTSGNWPSARAVSFSESMENSGKMTRFQPVRLLDGNRAKAVRIRNSGDFANLVTTDGFLEIPPHTGKIEPSTPLPYFPWIP
jgi:molybdopterin molybdotransferase